VSTADNPLAQTVPGPVAVIAEFTPVTVIDDAAMQGNRG
jgi:hypothetical protein